MITYGEVKISKRGGYHPRKTKPRTTIKRDWKKEEEKDLPRYSYNQAYLLAKKYGLRTKFDL